jgi:transposase
VPPRKKIDLPDHVRAAALAEIELSYRDTLSAEERFRVQLYLKTEQGLTTYELAEYLIGRGVQVSQPTIARWVKHGEEIYKRRESTRDQQPGEDPFRPGEPLPLG